MAWTGEHRGFVIEAYYENNRSVIATQRAFRREFALGPNAPVPSRNTILLWMANVRATGSATKRKPPGRNRTVTSLENVALVRASIEQSPRRSARKHATALGISSRSVRRILHSHLKMHPYKIMLAQELSVQDYASRRALCEQLLEQVPAASVLLSSDEAHFHLTGAVNKQNFRYWAEQNPRELHEQPLHSPRVTVWCAVGDFGVIGPYFFEAEGITVTVNSDRYVHMLETFLRPKLEEIDAEDVWFQQDGATAHTSRRSLGVLREMFPDRLISLRGDLGWPARSPDLSPCDFFLWGYLKEKVFKHRPRTLDDLKERITQEINAIPVEMTRRVMANFRERLRQCIANNGQHLQDVIFKTH